MSKLTPNQIAAKKARDNFVALSNRVKSRFSFKQIKTFRDLLAVAGITDFSSYDNATLQEEQTLDKIKKWLLEEQARVEADIVQCTVSAEANKETGGDTASSLQQIVSTSKEVEKDYGLISSPNEKAFLFWFQKKATKELLDGVLGWHKVSPISQICEVAHPGGRWTMPEDCIPNKVGKRGQALLAAVGTGKTFILGALFRRLLDMNFQHRFTPNRSPWPYVYVTKASILEQTKRVLKNWFNIDPVNEVLVINIDQLRSKFGELFVNEKVKVENGVEYTTWEWRQWINPLVIAWDECQALKNEGTQQHNIGASYNEIEDNTFQIFSSATPFTRVCEAKCFVVSTRIPYTFGIAKNAPMCNSHWSQFSKDIAAPADPIEHSPGAIDRLIDKMDPYIVRVKGVRPQFHAHNSVQIIDFQNEEDRKFYELAWERFLAEKAKLENDDNLSAAQSRFQILVEMLKFRQAAELVRAPYIAKAMWECVMKGKQASVAALNFKATIVKIVKILCYDYNVPRSQISLIWGGGAKDPNRKQKIKYKLQQNKAVLDALGAAGISMSDLDLDDVEAQLEREEFDPALKLGPQNAKHRQDEIDRFQSGKSLYCLFTFRAGGVGLSLHHTDEFTKEKVRRKESGYAVEEDIKKIPTRKRVTFVAPTWSAIELVQGLGRVPRLTSLSDTTQILVFYRGTIEERVARIVSLKLHCLTKVVRQKEDWSDAMVGGYTQEELDKKYLIADTTEESVANGDSDEAGGYFEDEEEEE